MMTLAAVDNLHQVLHNLYTEMMPLCSKMTDVAKAIAGLGALFYVANRVWQALSRAEPIDIYPLLRPFAIGLCIMFFPTMVLGTINTVMNPIVRGAHGILEGQTLDMRALRQEKDRLEEEALRNDPSIAWLVEDAGLEHKLRETGLSIIPGVASMYAAEYGLFNLGKMLRKFFRWLLEMLFQAAALVIDTIRTFFLIVLSILGPVAFAISVFDGFQATLTQWIGRYVSVYLWLPVSDLFSAILARIQVLSLQNDISQPGGFIPDGTDTVYIIFLLIGILGYFTIPSVANWVIQSGGLGSAGRPVNQAAGRAASFVGGLAGAAAGNVAGRLFGESGGKDGEQEQS